MPTRKNYVFIYHLHFFPELSIHIISLLFTFFLLIYKYSLYTCIHASFVIKRQYKHFSKLSPVSFTLPYSSILLLYNQMYKLYIYKYINLVFLCHLLVIERQKEESNLRVLGTTANIYFHQCTSPPAPCHFSGATLRRRGYICQELATEISLYKDGFVHFFILNLYVAK